MKEYTEAQKAKFVELAQSIGIGRARKELGYPSWPTGSEWCKARGVTPSVDTLMQAVKEFHTFYEDTDTLVIVDEAMASILEKFKEETLDADSIKKLAEALQKLVNTKQTIQGKPNSITETRKTDSTDVEFMNLLMAERARNDEEVTYQ